MKKALTLILVLLLCVNLAVPSLAADIIDSGSCGKNVTWTLGSDGTLTISGRGEMENYKQDFADWPFGTNAPWRSHIKDIIAVVVEDGVTSIGDCAFYWCDKLTSLTISSSVTSIGVDAFHSCKDLTDMVIPDSITRIGHFAFSGCNGLKRVVIPGGITDFGAMAFSDCEGLVDIFISDGVTRIGVEAFSGCKSLSNVYYGGSEEQWYDIKLGKHWDSKGHDSREKLKYTLHFNSTPLMLSYDGSDWAKDEAMLADKAGLITEHTSSNMTYDITRFQFAELIVNLVEVVTGKEISPAPSNTFIDCSETAVLKAYAAGIVYGITATTFEPETKADREQIAVMISRAISYIERETGKSYLTAAASIERFSDKGSVSSWAEKHVGLLAANGIMNGTSATELGPQDSCTTEQSILLVYRFFGRTV